jgi:hypothetical protein
VFAGHGGHFHGWDSCGIERFGHCFEALGTGLDIHHHALEGIELVNGRRSFAMAWLVRQVGLWIRSGDDG